MPRDYGPSVHEVAQGQWRGILLQLGLPESCLNGKHGPCPLCNAGTDRFRFDNRQGSGSYICGQCGAGTGIDLAMKFRGWNFQTAAKEVEAICQVHKLPQDRVPVEITPEQARENAKKVWQKTEPITPGSQVDGYLRGRGVGMDDYSESLRFHPMLRASETLSLPAMVARVVDVEGRGATLHRTFLDGHRKADIPSPRKLMPGPLPDGACVRLSGIRSDICLAEGIETALACEKLFQTPCWAVLSTSMMANWIAPEGVESVTICADNDPKYGGQKAAFALAHKLSLKGLDVNVRVPEKPDTDWNDVLLEAEKDDA